MVLSKNRVSPAMDQLSGRAWNRLLLSHMPLYSTMIRAGLYCFVSANRCPSVSLSSLSMVTMLTFPFLGNRSGSSSSSPSSHWITNVGWPLLNSLSSSRLSMKLVLPASRKPVNRNTGISSIAYTLNRALRASSLSLDPMTQMRPVKEAGPVRTSCSSGT